jgi:mutator protein MutT
MSKPHLEVSIALIIHDGSVLVARRHAHVHAGGCWEFPGGKRRAGETWEACLIRELYEELGVEATTGAPWTVIEHEYPEHTVRMRGYHCHIVAGEPNALASQEIRWIPIAKLVPEDFPPANQDSVQQLKRAYAAT